MWEAFIAGLYMQAGLAAVDHLPMTLAQVPYSQIRSVDVPVNPYGIVEIGWSRDIGRFSVELAARHMSSPGIDLVYGRTYQLGMDSLEFRVRFQPWR